MKDKIETAIVVPNECLKSTGEVYRQNYDDIFRKNHAVEVDPTTGELAEKKAAGETNIDALCDGLPGFQ